MIHAVRIEGRRPPLQTMEFIPLGNQKIGQVPVLPRDSGNQNLRHDLPLYVVRRRDSRIPALAQPCLPGIGRRSLAASGTLRRAPSEELATPAIQAKTMA